MLNSHGHELPPKFIQTKQDDKHFTRVLCKESSKAEPSFRVPYYGEASSAIPFKWESQPGTPKHTTLISDSTSLPPLTPPPSYHINSKLRMSRQKPPSKLNFLHTIFPRIFSKKNHFSPSLLLSSSSKSSSSSSSFYSLSSTPMTPCGHGRRCNILSRSRSTVHFKVDNGDDQQTAGLPTSTLCFGTL